MFRRVGRCAWIRWSRCGANSFLRERSEGVGLLLLRGEGRGQELQERDHDAEAVDDFLVEFGRSGKAGRKLLVKDVVLVTQQVGGGMVGGESARNAGELSALEVAELFAQRACGEDAATFFVTFSDALANGQ